MGDGSSKAGWAGGGFVSFLTVIGAWVYFFSRADSFWEFIGAFFQGLFWPAFMVYELFVALSG